MSELKFLTFLLTVTSAVQSARILGVFPTASISHQIVYQPIWKELSLRGHDVVVITTDPLNDTTLTNLTEIDVSSFYDFIKTVMNRCTEEVNHWKASEASPIWPVITTKLLFEHPSVAAFLNDTSQNFDVVIVEIGQVVSSFAYKYKCPFIGIMSHGVNSVTHAAIGNPTHPILYPDLTTTFGEEMTFFEKVDAVIHAIYTRIKYYYHDLPVIDAVTRSYIGEDMPYLGELERNASIVFLNTNPILHGARALSKGVVELRRMHLKPKKHLPDAEIKNFLDDADEAVIYFSFGSNVRSNNIDIEKRNVIIEALSELPYHVLWKFEDDYLHNKPTNVKISKWFPQNDILGHPKVKLFITQCGLQSAEEAIANETPMLAVPFFADQHSNAKRIAKLGIGLHLNFNALSKDNFKAAILEIINNEKYKAKIKEINKLMVDQPRPSLEEAIWWIEYTIRHKGAPYFRNRVVDMPWYQYFLLDIVGLLAVAVLLLIILLYTVAKVLIRIIINFGKVKTL